MWGEKRCATIHSNKFGTFITTNLFLSKIFSDVLFKCTKKNSFRDPKDFELRHHKRARFTIPRASCLLANNRESGPLSAPQEQICN